MTTDSVSGRRRQPPAMTARIATAGLSTATTLGLVAGMGFSAIAEAADEVESELPDGQPPATTPLTSVPAPAPIVIAPEPTVAISGAPNDQLPAPQPLDEAVPVAPQEPQTVASLVLDVPPPPSTIVRTVVVPAPGQPAPGQPAAPAAPEPQARTAASG